jgi:hypothetical protein
MANLVCPSISRKYTRLIPKFKKQIANYRMLNKGQLDKLLFKAQIAGGKSDLGPPIKNERTALIEALKESIVNKKQHFK